MINGGIFKKDSPKIHLFPVPKDLESRKKWLLRCGIYIVNPMPEKILNTKLFVCENHFDVSRLYLFYKSLFCKFSKIINPGT